MKKNAKNTTLQPSKPDNFSDIEWATLTPHQKQVYSRNPDAPKPNSGYQQKKIHRGGGPKEPKKPIGRPRKDGSLPIQRMTVSITKTDTDPSAPHPMVKQEDAIMASPSFKVEEADSIRDAIEINGLSLLNDAYARAARAAQSGDPFDRAVYLTLLGKAHPMAQIGQGKGLPGTAKKQMRILSQLLAGQDVQDGEFEQVKEGA